MSQIRLTFDSLEEVVAYADKRNLMYSVQPPKDKIVRPKAYAANFSVSRKVPWSH